MTDRPPTLRERFPELLESVDVAVPRGWVPLGATLMEAISALPREARAGLRFVQVKEKMGGLRASHRGGGPAARSLIRATEDESLHVCDRCGETGTLRCLSGTWATLCDSHTQEENV